MEKFLSPLQILDFPVTAGEEYARICSHLEKRGTIIGPNDLLIAAHCLHLCGTLVTNNEREFRRVPKLQFVNWLK